MLVLLVTGKRVQIIANLSTEGMKVIPGKYQFCIPNSQLKEGRPNYKPGLLILRAYPQDKRICVHHYLTAYLTQTLDLRGKEKKVFITTVKPYKALSPSTAANWVKTVLRHAGLDITQFTAGSTRSAVASKAEKGGAPIDDILKAGGWSRESTFRRFYDKPTVKQSTFADKVLKTSK